jgi:hypothetical protein
MNRRAALGAFAGLPALAILPSAGSTLALVSVTSPVHPDAALFAMQSAIDAADRDLQAAFDALNPVEDAYFDKVSDRPVAPKEAVFSPEEQQALDAFAARLREGRKTPSPARKAYEQAFQDHEREVERLKAECGLTAGQEVRDAVQETISQLQADLIDTPANTLAGLIFKARYAAAHYPGEWDKEACASTRPDRRSPPIGNGAQLPRSRRAATHRIALAKLTPNRFAAARQLMPSSRTAETTRLRKFTDNGPISRRPDSAHFKNQISKPLGIPADSTRPETPLERRA